MNTRSSAGAPLCAFLIFLLTSTAAVFAQSSPRELVFLNWSEYINPELVEKFEQAHDVRIRQFYFESDDLRDDILLETDGAAYDLVVVNGAMVDTYRKRGWLAELREEQVPNLRHVDAYWLDAFDGVRGHAVPYFWGTLGIGFRADLVSTPPSSWMDLFKPAAEVQGKIAMVDSQRDAMGMALKALGYSANSTDSRQIGEAMQLLLAQRPHVKTYAYLALNENSALVSGDIVMAMLFSGDALMLQEHHDGIRYVVPREGGNIWADYIAVMQGSRNKTLAYAFIDFINEPENAKQQAEYVYYATPNKAAEKLLPAEFLEDPVIYPSEEVLARSEAYKPLSPRAMKTRNTNFARLNQ
ncbi:MAG: spermidine/putrescine ABC transporter substrate-binding protein [Thiohalobacterales bacterium]|nr:spermidine/putrescine ABC transporter substrate-binding protein [Thiohalobacterales bacterium]